jgi:hypothetical protein
MTKRPSIIYILILLWLTLSVIFVFWGGFSLALVIQIPNWTDLGVLVPQLHFGYLISTIVWLVFAALLIIFAYGTFKKDSWVWTTGTIISTIFLAIFSLMLASFMVNAILFLDFFSIVGLVTVVISFIIDLGIVFYLTRPVTKLYFEIT